MFATGSEEQALFVKGDAELEEPVGEAPFGVGFWWRTGSESLATSHWIDGAEQILFDGK